MAVASSNINCSWMITLRFPEHHIVSFTVSAACAALSLIDWLACDVSTTKPRQARQRDLMGVRRLWGIDWRQRRSSADVKLASSRLSQPRSHTHSTACSQTARPSVDERPRKDLSSLSSLSLSCVYLPAQSPAPRHASQSSPPHHLLLLPAPSLSVSVLLCVAACGWLWLWLSVSWSAAAARQELSVCVLVCMSVCLFVLLCA